MCDARSVGPGDLLATDNYRETFSGESYHMVHKPEHKWYYLSEQTRDEALLFKIHDSSEEVEAAREFTPIRLSLGIHLGDDTDTVRIGCSHTAFRASDVRGTAEPRESIEVRCLVFFESEQA